MLTCHQKCSVFTKDQFHRQSSRSIHKISLKNTLVKLLLPGNSELMCWIISKKLAYMCFCCWCQGIISNVNASYKIYHPRVELHYDTWFIITNTNQTIKLTKNTPFLVFRFVQGKYFMGCIYSILICEIPHQTFGPSHQKCLCQTFLAYTVTSNASYGELLGNIFVKKLLPGMLYRWLNARLQQLHC